MRRSPFGFMVAGAAGAATLTAASAPAPLYPVYQRLWGFSAFTLTVVFAVYVVALLAALLTVGSLSDRLGRRPVASASLVLLVVGMLVFAGAEGIGALVVARIVQGFAVGAATGTLTAMIVEAAPTPRSASVASSAAPSLGIAVGAVLSGALVEYAPLPRQLVFWVLGAAYLVLAVLVWVVPEQPRASSGPRAGLLRSLLPSAGLPLETRPTFFRQLPVIGAGWAIAGLYLSLGSSVIGSLLGVRDHLVVGLVLAVFFVAAIGGTALVSALPERLREQAGYFVLASGVVLTTVATLLQVLPLYIVGSAATGVGFGATFRQVVEALGSAAPDSRRGQVFATMYTASYAAFSLPALGAGLAVIAWGLRATAVGYGTFVVMLVLVGAGVGARRSPRVRSRPGRDLIPVSTHESMRTSRRNS